MWGLSLADLKAILEEVFTYQTTRGKTPTHIYVEPAIMADWCMKYAVSDKILGMEMVPCLPLPMGKKEFFVCG